MSNLHKVYITSTFGSVDLEIGMFKCMGARHFSFHLLLLQHLPLGASLTVEYPSESVPPLSGEDGDKFSRHSFDGWGLGGLPHGQLVSALVAHPHPMSSAGPVLTAAGGHFPPMVGWNLTHWRPGWELACLDTLPMTIVCAFLMPPSCGANPQPVA